MSVKDFVGDKDFDIGTVNGEDMKTKKNSSVEVLHKMKKEMKCAVIPSYDMEDENNKRIDWYKQKQNAIDDVLLALEKQEKLKEWLDKREKENESNKESADNVGGLTSFGWGRYEELKDILKEVREVLK